MEDLSKQVKEMKERYSPYPPPLPENVEQDQQMAEEVRQSSAMSKKRKASTSP